METNKIYQGDCLTLLKKLGDESINCVITSPPYSNIKMYIDDNGVHPDNYVEWFMPIVKEIFRVLKPDGSFILNINDKCDRGFRHPYVFDLISTIHKETKFKMFERLFWNKMKGLPIRNRFGDRVEFIFWFVKDRKFKFYINELRIPYTEGNLDRMKYKLKKRYVRTEEDINETKTLEKNELGSLPTTLVNISSETKKKSNIHFAVFPEKLVEYFLKGCTEKGDLVLDPFMGSGTTAVVCKKLKLKWLGFEIQPEYIKEAIKRIL